VDSRTAKVAKNKAQMQAWIDDYGEDSDFVRVRVKGQFPRVGDSQFISTEAVEMAMQREIEPNDTDPIVIGVDVARFGDDQSVVIVRHGRKVVEIRSYRELDLMQMAARVVEAIDEYKPHTTFVDGAGLGAGVIDRLRQLSYRCIEVQAGSRPFDPDKYVNLRAEMWWKMREWIEHADLPDHDQLLYDLTGIEYGYDERMRVRLEKKSDMKKRGLPSPDCFVAGTMILTPQGYVPIERMREGDSVVTPRGVHTIVKVHATTTNMLTTVQFDNGKTLTGKGAHKIFTWDSGWVALENLTKYNVIESDSTWRLVLWQLLQKLYTTVSPFTFKHHVATISQGERLSMNDFFTVESGLTPTDKFQKIIASIMLTAIGRIMTCRILSVCPQEITQSSTCKNGLRIRNLYGRILRAYKRLKSPQSHGTNLLKDWRGTQSMAKQLGMIGAQWMHHVSNAVQRTRHSFHPDLSFALGRALNDTRISPIDTKPNLQYARGVEKPISTPHINPGRPNVALDPATTSYKAQDVEVYNLTLDFENVYYANGILVQNCADALSLTFAENVNPITRPRGSRRKKTINWRTL